MESHPDSRASKTTVWLVATLVNFLLPFATSSVNIALPSIGTEFTMDAVTLGWVAMSYLLTVCMFVVPFGRIADIYGLKRIFTYGIIIYTVSSLLAGTSISALMLVVSRVMQGIGSALVVATALAILASIMPIGERGRAFGVTAAASYIGLSLGPFLGGLLTEHFGWRSVFLVNVPFGLILIGSVFWKLKGEWHGARGEEFDLIGSFAYGLAIVALLYGFSLLPATSGTVAVLIGVLGILGFVWWETRAASPLLDLSLFMKNTVFAFSGLAALINYSATYAVTFMLSLYLQYIKGSSPESAGIVLLSMPAVQAILSPITGRLSDRIEPRVLASAGMGLTTVGLGLFISLGQNTSMPFILVSLIILGVGFALFSSPNTNAIMSSVDKRLYGVASAAVSTSRAIGSTLSMGVAMLVLGVYVGRVEITPEYHPAFLMAVKTAFTVSAILCFGGIFASLARGKLRQQP